MFFIDLFIIPITNQLYWESLSKKIFFFNFEICISSIWRVILEQF